MITFFIPDYETFSPSSYVLQINCVVMKGLNDDEICDFVQFTKEMVGNWSLTLRILAYPFSFMSYTY
jgi:uncharacterized Fe-S cluster-containing radical SAM superfamily enzyme